MKRPDHPVRPRPHGVARPGLPADGRSARRRRGQRLPARRPAPARRPPGSGDCRRRDVLEAAGVADCGGVLVLTNDDLLNVSTALTTRSLNPDVRIVVRMFNHNLLGRLGKARPQRLRPQHVDADRADPGPDRADRPGARRLPPRRPGPRPAAGRGADRPGRHRSCAGGLAGVSRRPPGHPGAGPPAGQGAAALTCWKWTRKPPWRPATGWWCAASRGRWRR